MSAFRIEYEFDNEAFMNNIQQVCSGDIVTKLPLRDLEKMTGISAATLSRIQRGALPDLKTFMSLCADLQLIPGDYFKRVKWVRSDE